MLLHPVGALLFERDESILNDTVWRYLLRADMESFHNASYGFRGSNVRRAELLMEIALSCLRLTFRA